jgi:seryl-tRNA synthetase
MLDITLLRKDVGAVADRLRARGFEFDTEGFHAIEAERKAVQVATEELQARRNALSKQIGLLKGKGEDATAVMAEAAALPQQLKDLEVQLGNVQSRLNELLLGVPNVPHASVPQGRSADDNVEVRR